MTNCHSGSFAKPHRLQTSTSWRYNCFIISSSPSNVFLNLEMLKILKILKIHWNRIFEFGIKCLSHLLEFVFNPSSVRGVKLNKKGEMKRNFHLYQKIPLLMLSCCLREKRDFSYCCYCLLLYDSSKWNISLKKSFLIIFTCLKCLTHYGTLRFHSFFFFIK